jgi:site-specific DNA-cytosine methylase
VPNHGDIKQIDWRAVEPVDVICGGYPCQPFSQQDNEKEQTTQDTYGHGYEQPLASYDPDTQSWRMYEGISLWGEHKLLESLPKSGMTRNGVLYQQPVWVRPIDEIASSLWPTPTTQNIRQQHATTTQQFGRCSSWNSKRDFPSGWKGTETDLPMGRRLVANANSGRVGTASTFARETSQEIREHALRTCHLWWEVEPDVGRVADGIPNRVDRLKGLGNAVVPQVAEYIGRLITTSLDA